MIKCASANRILILSSRVFGRRRLSTDRTRGPAYIRSLQLYNSLTASIEPLPNQHPFACYTCGPTVYAPAHLGHARTYVWVDILRRILRQQSSSPILFVMNITNVDDKILNASREEGIDPLPMASRLEAEFWRDMDALNVLRPHVVTRVTDHVDSHIVPFISDLVRHGFAYEQDDGIYFHVSDYESKTGKQYLQFRRIDSTPMDTDDSKSQRDFCLWKRQKPGEALVWQGPQDIPGRPGWHIECSAMIKAVEDAIQPQPFHLHIGGVDLQFPHHVNEIAQSQALQACCHEPSQHQSDWIPHWMHTGHLHIDGLKMSKSLKNFVTIQEFLQASITESPFCSPADDFRWWCLQSSYRGPSTFTQRQIDQARDQRMKVVRLLVDAQEYIRKGNSHKWSDDDRDLLWSAHETRERCRRALSNDMDGVTFSRELMLLIDLVAERMDRSAVSAETIQALDHVIRDLLCVVGFSDITVRAGLYVDERRLDSVAVGGERSLLNGLVDFRSAIRKAAMDSLMTDHQKDSELAQEIIALCDHARDVTFRAMGVELLDSATTAEKYTNSQRWRPCLPETTDGKQTRTSVTRTLGQTMAGRSQVHSVTVDEYFKVGAYAGLFAAFDEEGFPTAHADGSEISNRQQQKLRKKLHKHKRRLEGHGE